MTQTEKCVVVLSGGLDSTTVAFWAKSKGYDAYALSFNYGQIAEKEIEYARLIAEKLEMPIKVIDLSSLKEVFTGVSSLCDESIEMTQGFSQPIIVPFRNAIFLSIAVAYASLICADTIFYGAQSSDQPYYPDCRTSFYESFEKTARLGTDTKIKIKAPFGNLSKSSLIGLGSKLGVPIDLTWSCYLDGLKHCGKCESCINRKKAFEEAGVHDPTEYLV